MITARLVLFALAGSIIAIFIYGFGTWHWFGTPNMLSESVIFNCPYPGEPENLVPPAPPESLQSNLFGYKLSCSK